jgi:hypothetical protein
MQKSFEEKWIYFYNMFIMHVRKQRPLSPPFIALENLSFRYYLKLQKLYSKFLPRKRLQKEPGAFMILC